MANEVARIDDFTKEVAVFLSPSSRQREIAAYAVGALVAAQAVNRIALGRFPAYEVLVDGLRGAALTLVNPDRGVIEFEFKVFDPAVLRWILAQLERRSPTLNHNYQASHVLLADGIVADPDGAIPPAKQFTFVNTQPYARKVERGFSSQAPQGVYEIVAMLAKREFPDVGIRFGFAPAEYSWSRTLSAARLARRVRRGKPALHPEWLSRQPAIFIAGQ